MEHRARGPPFDQHLQRVDEAGQRQSAPAAPFPHRGSRPIAAGGGMGTVLPHRPDGVGLKPVITEQV